MTTATYSPEDNKIRLYPSQRLDDETFQRVKKAGFKWAPRQELFVAPKWTPAREDLAIELAGEIEAEEMTLAERAQAKADRLDALASKRAAQANAYSRRADELSQAFYMGQPILVGHHSERKARKTQERMHSAQDRAVKASKAVGYWMYRAEGVERHANRKNLPGVRARRIKTLLAELRDLQRGFSRAHRALDLWKQVDTPEQIETLAGVFEYSLSNLWQNIRDGKISPNEAKTKAIEAWTKFTESPGRARWIAHVLNRLSYEQELLGPVPRYSDELTPVILQQFVREHGGDKPKGKKLDDGLFTITTETPLPAHIGDGRAIEMNADEWRDLMQSCGYLPPAKKPAKPPILNFQTDEITFKGRGYASETETLPQIALTREQHKAATRGGGGWVQLSACGTYRARTCVDPTSDEPYYRRRRVAVFLTDSKAHPAPESLTMAEATQ